MSTPPPANNLFGVAFKDTMGDCSAAVVTSMGQLTIPVPSPLGHSRMGQLINPVPSTVTSTMIPRYLSLVCKPCRVSKFVVKNKDTMGGSGAGFLSRMGRATNTVPSPLAHPRRGQLTVHVPSTATPTMIPITKKKTS